MLLYIRIGDFTAARQVDEMRISHASNEWTQARLVTVTVMDHSGDL